MAFADGLIVGTKFSYQDTAVADSTQMREAEVVAVLEVGILVGDRLRARSPWTAREEAETDTAEGHGCWEKQCVAQDSEVAASFRQAEAILVWVKMTAAIEIAVHLGW